MQIEARTITVIEAKGLRGVGTEANPHRTVTVYFTVDGVLLAERDPWKEEQERLARCGQPEKD